MYGGMPPSAGLGTQGTWTLFLGQQLALEAHEPPGMTHIAAATDADLFRVIGYVHARFRLVQMDLERRQALGELAAVLGPSGLSSDTFELDLGLVRAAQRDWNQMTENDPARQALIAYSQGVNAAISQLESQGRLPAVFKLLGYRPQPWTPLDSLAVQELMAQTLSFTDVPLNFWYAARRLPVSVLNAWFPTIPTNPQFPWDPGPYRKLPLAPLPVRADPGAGSPAAVPVADGPAARVPRSAITTAQFADAAGPLERRLAALPSNAMHTIGNSNAWVIAGNRTQSGKPILSGDPHLQLTLPSDWYPVQASSPSYHFSGVTLPGLPVPLMGNTDSFAWAVTNAQRPATLYYFDQTSRSRPNQYFWDGAWRPVRTLTYSVQVKGQGAVRHTVRFTAEGPVLSLDSAPVPVTVWWAGALPTGDLDSDLQLLRAQNFTEFRDSLRGWVTPALDFLYAGKSGQIGAVSPGAAPQIPGHDIAAPLPGNGTADVTGTIPFDALPTAYDPKDGYLISANAREVTAAYPYQFSTSWDFADPGYRTAEITAHLAQPGKWTLAESAQLQNNVQDSLAQAMMPYLLQALRGAPLTAAQQQVAMALREWNDAVTPGSVAATFFLAFEAKLTYLTIEPWWQYYKVGDDPTKDLAPSLAGGTLAYSAIQEDLVEWVRTGSPYFALPNGTKRSLTTLMRDAFVATYQGLAAKHGADPARWQYGQVTSRLFLSLLSVNDFNVGPFPARGGGHTINAGLAVASSEATGGSTLVSARSNGTPSSVLTTGASWRFDIDWGTGQAAAVLPGGDSEDPMSPWYSNGIPLWLRGELLPFGPITAADKAKTVQWRFTS